MLLTLLFTSIQVLLFCREADANITWTAPPPQRGPLQTSDSSVRRTTQQLENNSPEKRLKWDFTLSGETLDRVTWAKGIVAIGRKTSSGIIVIEPTENFQEHFGISASDPATLIIKNVTKADAAVFRCSVETNVKTWVDEIQVEIVVPAKFFNNVTGDQSVPENSDLQLYCGASGNPPPNITWIRVFANGSESQVLHRMPTWNIAKINQTDAGTYRCTASNGVGDAVSHTLTVNVLYPSKIVSLPSEYNVTVQQRVSLHCQAEGNPTPSFTWTPCKDGCHNSTLVIPEVLNDTNYTCAVTNSLGSDLATTSIVIAGKEINITLTITGESCTNGQYNETLLSNRLTKEIRKVFAGESAYIGATLKDVRCGSLIVDLSLKFSSIVSEKWVLSILKKATKDGKLGEFNVAASSIKGTRPVISTTTSPPIGKTTPSSPDDINIGLIVGCAVGGFIALVIIIAVIIWCVRKNSNKDKDKKRKSKTSNKVSDNDAEGYNMAQFQGSHPTQGHGNNGYENTGSTSRPPAANAGKKDKKGKKKQDEPEKPVGVVYAQVDKSKRTSKPKEPEALYDQAERPNSKRPGELQYASPEDLHQGHSMPRNSGAQPKKPEAYTETQYAVLV